MLFADSVILFGVSLFLGRLLFLRNLQTFHLRYILRITDLPDQCCIGHTSDLRKRLIKYNKGAVPHTAKLRPKKVETYIVFDSEEKAVTFDYCLKSGSGHAFANRHF